MSKYPEWYIELDGEVLGELRDGAFADAFWASYLLVPYSDNAHDKFLQDELWEHCRFKYRHKKNNKYAPYAFSGGYPSAGYEEDRRIIMRGLYLPSIFDKIGDIYLNFIKKFIHI